MLARPARPCRRGLAGIGWLLDYSVAVVWTAWDGARVPRSGAVHSSGETVPAKASAEDLSGGARVAARPIRVAASLAVIGVLSLSIASSSWAEFAPTRDAADIALVLPVQRSTEQFTVAMWAPIIEDDGPASDDSESGDAPVYEADATGEAVETASSATEEPAPLPTPRGPGVDAAGAAETPSTATEEPGPEAAATPSPEPTPVPTPEPTPVPVKRQLTTAEMTSLALEAGWPEDLVPDLLSVAWCESRFHPEANGWGALGLMQIMPSWFTWLGIDVSLAVDPLTNLKVARYIYVHDIEGGYEAWASWACKPTGLSATVP